MRIVVSEPYILRFDNARDFSAMAVRLSRIVLNMPKDPLNPDIITVKASLLRQMLSENGKMLFNKHMEYKKSLEAFSLLDDNGKIRLDGSGTGIHPFRVVSYNRGTYKFLLAPEASEMTKEQGRYIYYDSKNLAPLKTSYSIALYEQLKKAQLKDIKPMLVLRREDLSEKNKSEDLKNMKATIERSARCVDKTDLHIIETDFSEDAIRIYAEPR